MVQELYRDRRVPCVVPAVSRSPKEANCTLIVASLAAILQDAGTLLSRENGTGFNGDDGAACATRQRIHICIEAERAG